MKPDPNEIPTIHESREKFLHGRQQIDYTERGYSIGELEGELTMFTMFPDYQNQHYTKDEIIKILKEIKRTDQNQFYLRIYKNQMGEPVWVDSENLKKKKIREREMKKTRGRGS